MSISTFHQNYLVEDRNDHCLGLFLNPNNDPLLHQETCQEKKKVEKQQ